jgi:putative membrane protein
MKRVPIIVISSVLGLLQACQGPDQKWDSKSSADTLNNMKDSVANPSVSITKDLVMKVSKEDARFAVAAANGGLAEVDLGKLAQAKGSSQPVRDFGTMMIKDHSAANQKLQGLAKSKGIMLPAALSKDEQELKNKLSEKSGKDFDKAYTKAMIEDHQNDIKEFDNAIHQLKDFELKSFANSTLPILKMHLESIKKVEELVKE